MVTTINNSKKNSRKFNLIFFIDSEKTYHYKFYFFIVKIVIVFLVLLVISSIISIVVSLSIFNKNLEQERYIINFKKNLLQYYFEKNLMKDEKQKEFEIANISKENFKSTTKDNNTNKLENNLNQATENSKKEQNNVVENPSSKLTGTPKQNSNPINQDQVNIIENSGIKLESPKIIQENNNTKITFSLLNTNTEKSSISGRVCAVIFGVNNKGENIIYKIPEKITLNSQKIPFSCKEGEQVRFSKLRPTEFIINVGKNALNVKKVNVFFSYSGDKGIVVNSF